MSRKSALAFGTFWERRPSKEMKRCGEKMAGAKLCAKSIQGGVTEFPAGSRRSSRKVVTISRIFREENRFRPFLASQRFLHNLILT